MCAQTPEALQQLIEELALQFESDGLPRMGGRILGLLLICEPPERTLEELAQALRGSKGSMSTMTRLLENAGLIERYRPVGRRRDHFRIVPEMWLGSMRRMFDSIERGKRLFERGLELLEHRPPEVRARLQAGYELYRFFDDESQRLLQRWESERRRLAVGSQDERRGKARSERQPAGSAGDSAARVSITKRGSHGRHRVR